MKINANISISRNSSDEIGISVADEASGITFLDLRLTPQEFAMALTGCAYTDVKAAEVRGMDVVGKRKVVEPRTVVYPGESYGSREEMRAWLKENGKEEGWIVDSYLGSQSSISRKGDETILNYSVYRFEAVAESEPTNG